MNRNQNMEELELGEFISKANILTRPLGVNYSKIKSSLLNPKLFFMFIACYADLTYNFSLMMLPYSTMRYEKMIYGDISTLAFDQHHDQIDVAQYCYRLSSVLMLTIFIFDKRTWISEASKYYRRIQTPTLNSDLLKLRKKCQNFAYYNCIGRQSLIFTAIVFITPNRLNEFGPLLIPSLLLTIGFIVFIPLLNAQFLMDLNLLCWTSVHCFKQINRKMVSRYGKHYGKYIHSKYIEEFSDTCCLVRELMRYARKIFLVFYSVNIVLVVFVIYAVFFRSTFNIFMLFLIATFACFEICEILYFSYAIGKIDKEAKMTTNFIYKHFLIKQNNFDHDKELWQFLRYFHTVWATNIGISFLGQPISPETSIKVSFTLLFSH